MGKLRTFLLIFMVAALGNFIPTHSAAQETTSFTERIAKLQALRAEQDALGEKWQANQDKLDSLGVQYDALDSKLTSGLGTLGNLRAKAETLTREYEKKLPDFNRRQARINVKAEEQDRDAAAYNAQCDRSFDTETEAGALAACNSWYARGTAADEQVQQDFAQLDREVEALEGPLNQATQEHDTLLGELQKMETQQQELVRQGMALETTSQEIVEAGRRLGVLIKELEGSICRPGDFATAEAFEECQRGIFDGGSGTIKGTIDSPIDMSPTGENETSPFDMDPNVVKPDWGEEEEEDDGQRDF